MARIRSVFLVIQVFENLYSHNSAFFSFYHLNEKCILVARSGEARIFDNDRIRFESLFRYDPKKYEDYWLLIDGKVKEDHLSKSSKAVVFASPQKLNYHEFIKQNGVILYMPTWSLKEVLKMATDEKLSEQMKSVVISWFQREQLLANSDNAVIHYSLSMCFVS